MQISNARQSKRLAAALLTLVLIVSQPACLFLGGETPTEKFARGNKEVQIILQEADKILNELMDMNLASPDVVITATKWGQAINAAQEPIITEAIKYLKVVDGREVLVIDEAGRDRLVRLTASLLTVSQTVIQTATWPGLSSQARIRISATLAALLPVVVQLASLAGKFKTVQGTPVSLRDLGSMPTTGLSACADCQTFDVPAGTLSSLENLQRQIQHTSQARERLEHKTAQR
jgi:hypothetical protein